MRIGVEGAPQCGRETRSGAGHEARVGHGAGTGHGAARATEWAEDMVRIRDTERHGPHMKQTRASER